MKRFLKRRWKRIAGILLALVVALMLLFSFGGKTYDASDVLKIRHGMTEREVEAVLGGPASSTKAPMDLPRGPRPHLGITKYWFADAGIIAIDFDDDGRVIGGAHFYSWEFSRRPNLLRRFLRWLGP